MGIRFARNSPPIRAPAAILAKGLPGDLDVTLFQECPADYSSLLLFFLSLGSTLQVQLAFIFGEGTKLICHPSSLEQRRRLLVNAIICKTPNSRAVSNSPHALNLQLWTSLRPCLRHSPMASGAVHLRCYRHTDHHWGLAKNADSDPVDTAQGLRCGLSNTLPGLPVRGSHLEGLGPGRST